jgi:hypothetical protein
MQVIQLGKCGVKSMLSHYQHTALHMCGDGKRNIIKCSHMLNFSTDVSTDVIDVARVLPREEQEALENKF